MLSGEVINILKTIEIIQKAIYIMLFASVGLGTIAVIASLIRISSIKMVISMILVVCAMIINIVSKFLTFDLMTYNVNMKTLIPAIILLFMQLIIILILLIIILKKKKKSY